jgi:hypothetical protein
MQMGVVDTTTASAVGTRTVFEQEIVAIQGQKALTDPFRKLVKFPKLSYRQVTQGSVVLCGNEKQVAGNDLAERWQNLEVTRLEDNAVRQVLSIASGEGVPRAAAELITELARSVRWHGTVITECIRGH